MRIFLYSLIALTQITTNSFSQEINFDWNHIIGNTGKTSGLAIQCDASGYIYEAGTFEGAINIDGVILNSTREQDGYLCKLDSFGKVIWSKQFSSYNNVKIVSLAIDKNDNIIILGNYSVSLKFDSITIVTNNADTVLSSNMFISKYDPNGNILWVKNTGGIAYDGNSINIDFNNDIIITGRSIDIAFFDTLISITTLDSIYQPFPFPHWNFFHPVKGFVAKYDQQGNKLWIKETGGFPQEIISDNIGNIIITGYFFLFDSTLAPSIGSETAFLAQYSQSGNLKWVKTSGGSANPNSGYGLAVDSANNVYQCGQVFGNNIEFGNQIIKTFAGIDAFLSKYDVNGNLIWNHLIGTPTTMNGHHNANCGNALQIDNNGDILILGYFLDTLSFGTTTLRSNGAFDLFLLKYNSSGSVLAAAQYSDYGWVTGNDLAIGNNNDIYLTGLTSKNYWNSEFPTYAFVGKINNSTLTSSSDIHVNRNQVEMVIYPNPSTGLFNIEFNDIRKEKRIEIISFEGKRILELTSTDSKITLEIRNKGIYFVSVLADSIMITRKLVVFSW